jgi:hypothetical protein
VVSSTGARFGANLTSAISAQGKLRFMLTKGRVTAAVLSSSSGDCWSTRGTDRVKLIDGHPTHRAKSVAGFAAEQAGMLELFFLPPDSPELNPISMSGMS